jgi:hypothetical protein
MIYCFSSSLLFAGVERVEQKKTKMIFFSFSENEANKHFATKKVVVCMWRERSRRHMEKEKKFGAFAFI